MAACWTNPRRAAAGGRRRGPLGSAAALLLFAMAPARAIDCNVPASRTTIQTAVADATCTRIVLAAQTFVESVTVRRSLEIVGANPGISTMQGSLDIAAGALLVVTDLTVAGCLQARVRSTEGARVVGEGLDVVAGAGPPCPIFADGFESGNANAWTSQVP